VLKRLVYASSVHALAEDTHAYMIDETIPFSPEHAIGEYGKSKARATAIVLESVKKGLDAVIVCPASVIGPYDFRPSKLGQFFLGFIKGKNPFFPGAAYNFVDVRDVAKGMILAAEQGIRGESYILSGERMSLHTLLSLMEKTTGCIMKKIQLPLWLCRIGAWFSTLYSRITKKNPLLTIESVSILASNSTMSYGKAWSILGFSPRPLSVTIADTIAWFKHYFKL
jgi:dihydroflavonol-4-reductase